MKLAISNIAWTVEEDLRVYELMNTYGFTGLEVAPTRVIANPYEASEDKIIEFKNIVKKYNIEIVALQSLHFGKRDVKLFGNPQERKNLLNVTKEAINFASVIGAKTLVFGSPKVRVINDPVDEMDTAISFFHELGEYANSKHVYLCIEANPKAYNTNFINDTMQAYELVKNVDSNGFKLHVDTGTILINGEHLKVLEKVFHTIYHVHLSEPFLEMINPRNKPFHQELLDYLTMLNYTKWLSVEMIKTSESNITNIENTLKYIHGVFGGKNV